MSDDRPDLFGELPFDDDSGDAEPRDEPAPGDDPDPFTTDDPDTREREARRLEREARRKQRESGGGRRFRGRRWRRKRDADDSGARETEPPLTSPPAKEAEKAEKAEEAERAESPELLEAGNEPIRRESLAGISRNLDQLRAGARRAPRLPRLPGAGRGPLGRLLIAVIAIVLVAFLFLLFEPFRGDGEGSVAVTIPEGAGIGEVASLLDERGVISNATLFEIRATLAGKRSDVLAGTYDLRRGMSYGTVLEAITEQPAISVAKVTIPEGRSRPEIAAIARQAGLSGDYEKASRRSPELKPRRYGAKDAEDLEGFLFPASYELKPGSSVEDLVSLQLQAFKEQIADVPLGDARSKNLTIYDVLTIASMVEREVAVAEERPLVAAVIYNRLRDGEPLGIDATVRFAVGNYDQPLTSAQLNSPSPYNTRNRAGLPPGPIGNPGLDSILAAARPARVDYRFFVVKPGTCGEHVFATTEEEFLRAQARYEAARERAGGRSPTKCPE